MIDSLALVIDVLNECGLNVEAAVESPTARLADIGNVAKFKTMHPRQADFVDSMAKRKVVRAGRRGGKTIGAATLAAKAFLAGRRVLYAAPTQEQIDTFWSEVKLIFQEAFTRDLLYKNETRHLIEIPFTQVRLRAKTAWNADSLRGDYASLLILDEFQLMNEDAWGVVGAPMMLDTNGDAVFIYTPPSARTRSVSKANDKRHASKLYKRAEADTSGNWSVFHFRSLDNPGITQEALDMVFSDMTRQARRQELEAIDEDNVPGALWNSELIEAGRVTAMPKLIRIVVAIDPSASSAPTADEAGIIGVGLGENKHGYILSDATLRGSPDRWAKAAIAMYNRLRADRIVAEKNNGGEMITAVLKTVDADIPVRLVWASRGKETRAEPVAALYEQGKVHHVGEFPDLEDEMTGWAPGDPISPNRMDALVWGLTALMVNSGQVRTGVI